MLLHRSNLDMSPEKNPKQIKLYYNNLIRKDKKINKNKKRNRNNKEAIINPLNRPIFIKKLNLYPQNLNL